MRLLILTWLLVQTAFAGESGLTVTYQPLDGLGAGNIRISEVTCHDWYGHSGMATQIGLISSPNVPPTNNPKEATQDINLASVCGIRFGASDIGDRDAPLALTLNATKFAIPQAFDHPREDILRASLECLRRCLPAKLRKTPVTLTCRDPEKAWMLPIVTQFNAHDRGKVFFIPQE